MRLRLLVLLAWLLVPVGAFAKPTLAVAPIDGDKGGKIAKAVAEAAEEEADVIGPAKVEAMMKKLSIKEIDGRAVKKLRKKLDAEVLVYGSVDDGSRDKLELKVSARGKKTQTIEMSFTKFDAKAKKRLGKQIRKQIDDAESDESNNDEDEEEEQARREKEKEREREKEKEARRKKDDDEDGERKKRTAKKDDDDEDGERVRKRRRDDDDDDDDDRPKKKRVLATQAAIRLDAGAAMARRALTYAYAGSPTNPPPGVGTLGPAGRIEAEIYPGSFDTLKGPAANVGLVASFEKTFAVGIDVPGTSVTSTVDQARYEVGARYRIPFGTSAVAFGASYWHRHYKMSRDGLTMPTQLDAPDVSYNAVSPNVMVRIGASKELAVFFGAAGQLMLSTGQIQEDTSFGPANVLAFEAEGGVDYMVAKNIAVHVAAEFGQVGLKFKRKTGTMSASRGIASATDRIIGASASLTLLY